MAVSTKWIVLGFLLYMQNGVLSNLCCSVSKIDLKGTVLSFSDECLKSDLVAHEKSCEVVCGNNTGRVFCYNGEFVYLKDNLISVEKFDAEEFCREKEIKVKKIEKCPPLKTLPNGVYPDGPCTSKNKICKFLCNPGYIALSNFSCTNQHYSFTECTSHGWTKHSCQNKTPPAKIPQKPVKKAKKTVKKEAKKTARTCSVEPEKCTELPKILSGKGKLTGPGCSRGAPEGTSCAFVCVNGYEASPSNSLECSDSHGVVVCRDGDWESAFCRQKRRLPFTQKAQKKNPQPKPVRPKRSAPTKPPCGKLPQIPGGFLPPVVHATTRSGSNQGKARVVVYYYCWNGLNRGHAGQENRLKRDAAYVECVDGRWTVPHCFSRQPTLSATLPPTNRPAKNCTCESEKGRSQMTPVKSKVGRSGGLTGGRARDVCNTTKGAACGGARRGSRLSKVKYFSAKAVKKAEEKNSSKAGKKEVQGVMSVRTGESGIFALAIISLMIC